MFLAQRKRVKTDNISMRTIIPGLVEYTILLMISSKWIVGRSSPLWGQTVKIRISNYVFKWPFTPTKDWIYPQFTRNWSLVKWCIDKRLCWVRSIKMDSLMSNIKDPLSLSTMHRGRTRISWTTKIFSQCNDKKNLKQSASIAQLAFNFGHLYR